MKNRRLQVLLLGILPFVSCFQNRHLWNVRPSLTSTTHVVFASNDLLAEEAEECREDFGIRRRELLALGGSAVVGLAAEPARALPFSPQSKSSLLLITPKKGTSSEELITEPVETNDKALSSERCLLKLLPVKNNVFRSLEDFVETLSSLRSNAKSQDAWETAHKTMVDALDFLDTKRRYLEPVFDPEQSTAIQIEKAERGERLIESFREKLVKLMASTRLMRVKETFAMQKAALLALVDIGELLVAQFPYDVPVEGKFSFLPRLLGRARVTFAFSRDNKNLGNVTIMADGYAAPITAGNFVDLAVRGFYTGLPVKAMKKKFGGLTAIRTGFLRLETVDLENDKEDLDTIGAVVPVLGSYNEGFYDPLTAKPRRIPLEILRQGRSTGISELSYARGFSTLPSREASVVSYEKNKPILSFDIPGLVALNHPDKEVNGGSSEFFCLQADTIPSDKRSNLDGQYAPFGYIIDGYDLFQSLQPGDVIESTGVGEWGALNLAKIRGASFSDVVQREDGGEKEDGDA